MAAPAGWRFWGPVALILCGPLGLGSATEPVRHAADEESAAVVHSRQDAHAGASSAEDLVRAALKAEAAGKWAERERLLGAALEKDPNYAPARWRLGYVRVGQEWVKWDEVERRAAADPRVAEYRRRFDEQAGTPAGELALARWCRSQGLDDHARFHWLRVVSFQPQNEEALKALGMRWYRGQLLTHEQIVAARHRQGFQTRQGQHAHRNDWSKHWAPRVTKWQRMIQAGDAAVDSSIRKELEAVKTSSGEDFGPAIQGLGAVLVLRSGWQKDAEAYRRLSRKWVQILDAMPDPQAAFSLARLAVDHPVAEVRMAAADALKKRPKQLYVPLLIARMRTPIEASFSLVRLPLGGAIYQQSVFREGIDADFESVHSHSVSVVGSGPSFDPPPPSGWRQTDATRMQDAMNLGAQRLDNEVKMAQATMRAGAVATVESAATQRRVQQFNAAIQEVNQRAQAALSRATGIDREASPLSWYEWWMAACCDYFDVEQPPKTPDAKPVYQSYSHTEEATYLEPRPATTYEPPAPPPPRPVPAMPTTPALHHPWHFNQSVWSWQCCFPRGTTVWTLTGPMPIDEIKVGDRVLSQHPVTGELTYKPVLLTTTRKPEFVTRITLGSEVIAATRGHAFLVAGQGWRMAKQLKAGMRLHGLGGSVLIDGLEDVGQLKPFYERLAEKPDANAADDLAYNLVVGESHTYFVGRHRVLVFDGMFAALANLARAKTAVAP